MADIGAQGWRGDLIPTWSRAGTRWVCSSARDLFAYLHEKGPCMDEDRSSEVVREVTAGYAAAAEISAKEVQAFKDTSGNLILLREPAFFPGKVIWINLQSNGASAPYSFTKEIWALVASINGWQQIKL